LPFEKYAGHVEGGLINPPGLTGSGFTTPTGKKVVFAQHLHGVDG
jgi:hypothetical protein